ncbi:metal-dependent hydrolase [Saccharolobus islandicus]|uniref:Membrane-bound metal-dependent hydrolase (DUF457) n=1 Tax=Saccharolobus islandicus (strain REY15A) TaxID=930945 RepID=F0NIR8_SACI5|nr:metal-dependent hydrolase [Sulfolobus islandicus]ADX85999.1 membrane-bound metal-dependent hydrolase (DUF457) [Sulfolobus islandicus REY15A]
MNLNSHILFGIAIGIAFFHNIDIAILIGIGAALPDLDREYILTNKLSLAKHQLHRALFHNIFFALLIYLLNQYLGIGVILHILLDMLTSPADRGVEVLFPLGRLINDFHLDYDGIIKDKKGLLWYIEDPVRIIRITSDKDLIPSSSKSPWIRVYGPFKNSRIADWTIFYSSILFLILFNIDKLQIFSIQLIYSMIKYSPLILGIILFYTGGEIWRRKFQRTGKYRNMVAIIMLIGVAFLLYGIKMSISTLPFFSESSLKLGITSLISIIIGFIIAYIHVKKRHKLAIM